MQEMWQQYLHNLAAGDQTTLIATLVAAIVVFFMVRVWIGILKALILMVVLLVGAALFFPDAQVMQKVGEGAKTALDKGKAVVKTLKETETESMQEKVKTAINK